MNPLKKYPHLFCNEKFYTIPEKRVFGAEANKPFKITYKHLSEIQQWVCEFTLIARPINDMTDKEIYEVMDYREHYDPEYHTQKKEFRMDLISRERQYYIGNIKDFESRQSMLYLLSIGVYPFDQQHFEDGTVINTTKIKQII